MHSHKRPQSPKGYQFAYAFQYPKIFVYINKLSLLFIPFSLYLLARLGMVGGVFQNLADLGSSSGMMLVLALIILLTDFVRGLIQRGISKWFGYTISFDDPAFPFMLRTYTAAPGQFQSRRDVLLIAMSPFGVFLLLGLPLLFGLSGIVGGILLFFLIANILGTFWDFYLMGWLLGKSPASLIYTENAQKLLIFEPIAKTMIKRRR